MLLLVLSLAAFSFAGLSYGDYIRSDEILLDDNLEIGSQIINLNRLIENEKERRFRGGDNNDISGAGKSSIFKMVNDSSLLNYIDLKYVNDANGDEIAVVILKKRLVYEDVCEASVSAAAAAAIVGVVHTQLDAANICQQTLKIVAINENDFIEIPIEIRKVSNSLPSSRLKKLLNFKLAFQRTNVTLKPLVQSSIHLIDYPIFKFPIDVTAAMLDELTRGVDFSLINLDSSATVGDYLSVRIEKKLPQARKIRISVQFKSETSLLKAFDLKLNFRFRVTAYLTLNASSVSKFDATSVSQTASLDLILTVDDMKILNLKPLDFEYPIYSVSIENSNIDVNDTVLEPKLKQQRGGSGGQNSSNSIIFSLFLNEDVNQTDFPFFIDETTGVIRLRSSSIWNDGGDLNDAEKLFNFGIKATYRSLLTHSEAESSKAKVATTTNYYYSYMIPAFAKIQISVLNKAIVRYPVIRSQLISPFISKYEILNEESNNQTFILYINDPFSVNSKLIKFFIDKAWNRSSSSNGGFAAATNAGQQSSSPLYWLFDNYEAFYYDDHATNLTMLNRIEFRDQFVYRTNIKLAERLSRSSANRILAELNIQFRVDFDPLLFEKNEYKIYLTQTDLVQRNLVRIKLKNRLKSIINNNKHDNVTYRLAATVNDSTSSEDYFDVNTFTGWLQARRELFAASKTYFELEIVAVNMDLQKSASVKCKIYLNCAKLDLGGISMTQAAAHRSGPFASLTSTGGAAFDYVDLIRFSLFDNSPNRTQIGVFKSVCSESGNYAYMLDAYMSVKICSKEEAFNCKLFNLNNRTVYDLFSLSQVDGVLMTNNQISLNSLLALIREESSFIYNQLEQLDFYENINYLSILLKGSVVNLEKTYLIEILIQNIPRLVNFNSRLLISEVTNEEGGSIEANTCLYDYKYTSDYDFDFESFESSNAETRNEISKYSLNSNLVSRFVRVDKNSAHLEADFKLAECHASFFIYNNGCLALKSDYSTTRNDSLNRKCLAKSSRSGQLDYVLLRTGIYNIEFKLCFYNNNKVSCSNLYNQTLMVKSDILKSSRFQVSSINGDKLDKFGLLLDNIDKQAGDNDSGSEEFSLFKKNGFSVYVLILFIVILVVALIAIFSFLFLFIKPKYHRNDKSSNSSEKAFVLPNKGDLSDFKNSEVSSESSSRTRSSLTTPETSSNAATSSSKISKTDDENDEIVKIQVIDDYLSKNLKNSINKYGCANNNFSYAGSFSSIGSSSYESSQSEDMNKIKAANALAAEFYLKTSNLMMDNNNNEQPQQQHGLYSVKTASIQFNSMKSDGNQCLIVSDGNNDYDLFETRENELRGGESLIQQHLASSSQLVGNNSSQHSALNPKTSSLKKLKKEIALKKSNLNNSNFSYSTTSPPLSNNTNNAINGNSNGSDEFLKSSLIDDKAVYEYLSKNQILLNPSDIIASVV